MKFEEKLLQAAHQNNSLLCIGLDPDPELMPDVGILEFNTLNDCSERIYMFQSMNVRIGFLNL